MSDQDKRPNNPDSIAPAPVTLNVSPDREQHNEPGQRRQTLWLVAGLIGCGLLLVLVIVALPQWVDQSGAPVPSTTSPTTASSSAGNGGPNQSGDSTMQPPAPTESPWQDAQLAKARRETQELLAKLLDRQDTLENLQVKEWAADDYEQAQELAATADKHYQQREYDRAKSLYQESLTTFDQLIERSETVYQTALQAGQKALVNGDASLAQDKFQLAAAIKPDSEAVQKGLERSGNLDKVLALIDEGQAAEEDGELTKARQHYRDAVELDPAYQPAQQHLNAVNNTIADRNFSRHMSKGFAAMSRDDYPAAIKAFDKALTIKPQAEDARTALRQAQNQQTQTRIQTLLSQAKQHEAQEQWRDALAAYQKILELDENVAAARAGKIRTQTRAGIDQRLEKILAEPQRLTSPAVHREYRQLLTELKKFQSPGERLQNQIRQLEQALEKAVEPVTVTFNSDNATQVTVYGVEKLGTFEQTQLTLKPGEYTAVGIRRGYRDVRREFTVSADNPNMTITIQCEETISAG